MSRTLSDFLHAGGYTLALENLGRRVGFTGRGVADLRRLLREEPELLRGASVADKVVGKGAAALMLLGGVARLHADVISRSALRLLEIQTERPEVSYDTLTDGIRNRRGDGPCPVEALCAGTDDLKECYTLISEFTDRQHDTRNPTT